MELTLQGSPAFHTEGTVTVELPAYMQLLPDDELKEALSADNRNELIVAAGRHTSGAIVFMTGDGDIREIDMKQFHVSIPDGRASPTDNGQMVKIELVGFDDFEVSSDWAIRVSKHMLSLGTLADKRGARVSYVDT